MAIIYFLTPQSIIKVTTKAAEFVPIIGPGVEYVKKAKQVTDIADPVTASSRGVGLLFKTCFGKTAVVSAECVLWFGLSVAGGITANPTLIGAGTYFGNMVLDELL